MTELHRTISNHFQELQVSNSQKNLKTDNEVHKKEKNNKMYFSRYEPSLKYSNLVKNSIRNFKI